MSIAIAVKVFTSERMSAPPSIVARAVAVMSSTLGESFTISGLCGRAFFTAAVNSRSRPGCVPKVRPSFTFGQETLSSTAATQSSPSIAPQVSV